MWNATRLEKSYASHVQNNVCEGAVAQLITATDFSTTSYVLCNQNKQQLAALTVAGASIPSCPVIVCAWVCVYTCAAADIVHDEEDLAIVARASDES